MRLIPCSQSQTVIVDDEDFARTAGFRWFARRGGATWYVKRNVRVGGKKTGEYLHRFVLGLRHGDPQRVDHINGNGLDNRRSNLRIADHVGNMQNSRTRKDNISGYRGVHWNPRDGRWVAQICVRGQRKSLGYYDTKETAADAYYAAAVALHGEFMRVS